LSTVDYLPFSYISFHAVENLIPGGRGQIKSQLTPYESSVLHLDKQGVDVNDLIESDSDSFSAKCVVVNKAVARKNIYVVPNTST
jgi:hypothetical protein